MCEWLYSAGCSFSCPTVSAFTSRVDLNMVVADNESSIVTLCPYLSFEVYSDSPLATICHPSASSLRKMVDLSALSIPQFSSLSPSDGFSPLKHAFGPSRPLSIAPSDSSSEPLTVSPAGTKLPGRLTLTHLVVPITRKISSTVLPFPLLQILPVPSLCLNRSKIMIHTRTV